MLSAKSVDILKLKFVFRRLATSDKTPKPPTEQGMWYLVYYAKCTIISDIISLPPNHLRMISLDVYSRGGLWAISVTIGDRAWGRLEALFEKWSWSLPIIGKNAQIQSTVKTFSSIYGIRIHSNDFRCNLLDKLRMKAAEARRTIHFRVVVSLRGVLFLFIVFVSKLTLQIAYDCAISKTI